MRRILDAAMAVVMRDGLDSLTIKGIADDLDRAAAGIYNYFPSKDALVARLEEEVLVTLVQKIKQERRRCAGFLSSRDEPGPAGALLEIVAMVRLHVELAGSGTPGFRLLSVLLGDPRPILDDAEARRVLPSVVALLAEIEEIFARAVEAGALRQGPSKDRAILFLSSLQGLLQLNKLSRLDPELLSVDGLAPTLVETLLTGWGADPATLQGAWKLQADLEGGSGDDETDHSKGSLS